MGQRGPRPLPKNVHQLRGNPSKLPLQALLDTLQPEIEIPGCPSHLMPEAKKEWRRITPELERYGLISKLDRAALALYCQSWAQLVYAEKQLARSEALATARKRAAIDKAALEARQQARQDGVAAGYDEATIAEAEQLAGDAAAEAVEANWTGGDGWTVPTPNGHMTYSPYWVMANRAREQVDKFLAAFGLSPSSRGRVNPSNLRQQQLDLGGGGGGYDDV